MNVFYSLLVFILLATSAVAHFKPNCHRGGYGSGSGEVVVIGAEKPEGK